MRLCIRIGHYGAIQMLYYYYYYYYYDAVLRRALPLGRGLGRQVGRRRFISILAAIAD